MDYLAMPEFWLAIPDLEDFYEASSHGNIRSIGERVGRGRPRGNTLTPSPRDKAGHLRVTLSVRGKRICTDVAPLIARTFIGPRPPGQEVCHGPAGIGENNPGNLYYGTRKRNSRDRLRDGTWMSGEANGNRKLDWIRVSEIRRRSQAGESDRNLAAAFGVTRRNVWLIRTGRAWIQAAGGSCSPP